MCVCVCIVMSSVQTYIPVADVFLLLFLSAVIGGRVGVADPVRDSAFEPVAGREPVAAPWPLLLGVSSSLIGVVGGTELLASAAIHMLTNEKQ